MTIPSAWILMGVIAIASYLIQLNLKNKFEKYSKVMMSNGMTGKDVAQKMLSENRINDVKVKSTDGFLTDFYNPTNQTVNLSQSTYESNSIAAAAVAAHECGHAIQHADLYGPLKLRTSLVPVVNLSSSIMQWVLLAGLLLVNHLGTTLLLIGIILYATTTLFAFVTLPVEVNASQRAVQWLDKAGIVDEKTKPMVEDALKAAAYTYVVAAIGSLGTLIYYIQIFNSRRS